MKRMLLNASGVSVGQNTKIVGPIKYGNSSEVIIGSDCWVGKDFSVHGNGRVVIGDCCDIAPEVTILTGSHKLSTPDRRAGEGISYTVTVGNGCWLGARSTIVGNVRINDGVVVGTCSLVNKSVEPNLVVGGVPAKTIKVL